MILPALGFMLVALTGCSRDSPDKRIKDAQRLSMVKKVALVSFGANRVHLVGSDTDQETNTDPRSAALFGAVYLTAINKSMADNGSGLFVSLKDVMASKAYAAMKDVPYERQEPGLLASSYVYDSPVNDIHVFKIAPDSAKELSKSLGVDAVLGTEVTFRLAPGWSMPILGTFFKPKWYAEATAGGDLYDNGGVLVWQARFNRRGPIHMKADKSLNLAMFSNSSIGGDKMVQIVESAAKEAADHLVESIRDDIQASRGK
jgi:hypothetical protein